MTPELETCLNYCDHGEGAGEGGTGTPYLPTLRGLIVNAVNAETSFLQRQLADEKQKVANLEEYMLKGVAFRDELQARVKELECQKTALQQVNEEAERKLCRITDKVNEAQLQEEDDYVADVADILATSSPCRHAAEADALREAVEKWILSVIDAEVILGALMRETKHEVSRDAIRILRSAILKWSAELRRRADAAKGGKGCP